MNKVILTGNIGNDPEIINLDSGKKLAKFSIATNEQYTNSQGEKIQDTEWHNVVVFGKVAEVVEKYFNKGLKVLVEGKIKTRSYETKEGEKRYSTEIIMNNFEFLQSSSDNDSPF